MKTTTFAKKKKKKIEIPENNILWIPGLTSLHAILFRVFVSWARWTFPNEPLGMCPGPRGL